MMTEEFNRWWDADELTKNNPFQEDTRAFWAWEGWRAAVARCAVRVELRAGPLRTGAYDALIAASADIREV